MSVRALQKSRCIRKEPPSSAVKHLKTALGPALNAGPVRLAIPLACLLSVCLKGPSVDLLSVVVPRIARLCAGPFRYHGDDLMRNSVHETFFLDASRRVEARSCPENQPDAVATCDARVANPGWRRPTHRRRCRRRSNRRPSGGCSSDGRSSCPH